LFLCYPMLADSVTALLVTPTRRLPAKRAMVFLRVT
jgi:hypothetical protein